MDGPVKPQFQKYLNLLVAPRKIETAMDKLTNSTLFEISDRLVDMEDMSFMVVMFDMVVMVAMVDMFDR